MYITIAAGDIDTSLIDIATRFGNEVAVIERDTRRADSIASEYDCIDAPIVGETLTEADNANRLPDDALIAATGREGQHRPLTPRSDTRIEAGDLLSVYSSKGANPERTDVSGHYEGQTVEV